MKFTIETGYADEYEVAVSTNLYGSDTLARFIERMKEVRDRDYNPVEPIVEYRDAPPREAYYGGEAITLAIRAVRGSIGPIEAIKLYRYLVPGTSLRDAKDEVERINSFSTE